MWIRVRAFVLVSIMGIHHAGERSHLMSSPTSSVLSLLSVFVSVDLSVGGSIKLGRALVALGLAEVSCGRTGYLSLLSRKAINIIIIITVRTVVITQQKMQYYN